MALPVTLSLKATIEPPVAATTTTTFKTTTATFKTITTTFKTTAATIDHVATNYRSTPLCLASSCDRSIATRSVIIICLLHDSVMSDELPLHLARLLGARRPTRAGVAAATAVSPRARPGSSSLGG